jgi:protein-L-isoaspartate(D-aspartate) O-methyltransferase
VSVSSVSAPWLQAMMIGQAGVVAGMRVMEIGSGGYNAAGSATTISVAR